MAATPTPARTLTTDESRSLWAHNQRLGSGDDALSAPGGWIRSLGGTDPYLSMLARDPALDRERVDAAVAGDGLWVLPGVRGCIWILPAADAALCLTVGFGEYHKRTVREMAALDVSDAELHALGQAVLGVLGEGAMTPEELRAALPDDAVRRLGDAGKKKGHTTTLPAALRFLEGDGHIRRYHQTDGLNSGRYAWGLATENLVQSAAVPPDEAERTRLLAERYFSWAGPATLTDLCKWGSFGKRAAQAAINALDLVPVALEGSSELAWVTPATLAALPEALAADEAHLIPGEDNLIGLRTSPAAVADPAHHHIEVFGMGKRMSTIGAASWVFERPIVHRGRWVGLWEWDLDAATVIWAGFEPLPPAVERSVATKAALTARFIAEQLGGSARAHSIDNEARQRQRAEHVKALR